jgi:hypothetical protein
MHRIVFPLAGCVHYDLGHMASLRAPLGPISFLALVACGPSVTEMRMQAVPSRGESSDLEAADQPKKF